MKKPTKTTVNDPLKMKKTISKIVRKTNIVRVALTGGPCAGKTTILSKLTNFLESRGFGVLCVPEACTLMASGGINLN